MSKPNNCVVPSAYLSVFERVIDHPELASEKLSLKELEYLFAD